MKPSPVLQISDGATTIDLLNLKGIILSHWTPAVAEPKSGGVWADSPIVEGRKLAYRQRQNIVDSFEMMITGYDQDDVFYRLANLRNLLERAVEYWLSDNQNVPVFIKARGPHESSIRYATINDYRTPTDGGNPYASPLFSCNPVANKFVLTLEHGLWQDNPPGQGACVEIGAQQVYSGVVSGVTEQPAAGADDAYVRDVGDIYAGSTFLMVGNQSGIGQDTGIRFPGVGIPAGATILRAWLELVGFISDSTGGCHVIIDGEDVDDAAAFSTYADFVGRSLTAAQVAWSPPHFGWAGWTYETPDLTAIIQEIVDRPGWASGQDMALFLHDSGSAFDSFRAYCAYEHPTYAAPTLRVQYTESTGYTFGRAATCLGGEVFIGNKQNTAPITNIYHYDDSTVTFSANLVGAATPFAFLPATPAADDIAYFGSLDGPFNSLVFDISTAQVDLTTIVWEYWSGAAWSTLTVQDNTATTDPFDRTGVHSVHWASPANWNTTAINAVTAYWVRARVTVVGASPAPPEQDNRNIYTCVWPYVELQADQVGGDIPALAEIKITNQSDAATGSPVLHTNRLMIGARSLSRGENFTAYLNVSDEQNPTGVTVALGANTAYAASPTTPTGRRAAYSSPAPTTETTEVTITLDNTLSPEYLGRFRAFLRYYYYTGAADATAFRLVTTPGGSGLAQVSDYYYPQVNTDYQIADMGIVNIQPRTTLDEYGTITFEIKITPDGTVGMAIYLYDLILIPVDEWATDAVDESGLAARTGAVGNGDLLDIDSVTYPRKVDQAILRQVSDGRIIGYFANRQPGPALLQANAAQRLWFLSLMYESGTEVSAPIAIAHTVQVNRAARYHSARGRR